MMLIIGINKNTFILKTTETMKRKFVGAGKEFLKLKDHYLHCCVNQAAMHCDTTLLKLQTSTQIIVKEQDLVICIINK